MAIKGITKGQRGKQRRPKGQLVEGPVKLPDGSGYAIVAFPLPKDPWLYIDQDKFDVPPMPFRTGTGDERRESLARDIQRAARYAIRAATEKGKVVDFDPDVLVQNMVTGMLGYHTPDGLAEDDWANPPEHRRRPALDKPKEDGR